MTISVAEFRTRFPEFADDEVYTDLRVAMFISDAAVLYMGVGESTWCGKYDIAQAYLSAHLLSIATATEVGDSSNKVGAVASKSAGGVSVTRATQMHSTSTGDEFLSSTSYGQQFLNIRNLCFAHVMVANNLNG